MYHIVDIELNGLCEGVHQGFETMPFLAGLDNKSNAFEVDNCRKPYNPKMIECSQNDIVAQLHQTDSSE